MDRVAIIFGAAAGAAAVAGAFFVIGQTMGNERCRAEVVKAELRCQQFVDLEEGGDVLAQPAPLSYGRLVATVGTL
jgi:hypothetical protein